MQQPFSSGFVVELSPQIITGTKCTMRCFFSPVIADLQVIVSCVWLGVAALLMTLINKHAGLLIEILQFIS